jgi:arylsulfatase A-like enzyme
MGCASAGTSSPSAAETSEKPNVLFIIMDDMCDWAHYLGGHPQAITPNLDRLASRGVMFSNAYTAVPFSNPSRAAMLTGLPPTQTGIYQNTHQLRDSPAAEACIYLPEHFHNNGYRTLWAGKIFHNRPSEERLAAMWDDQQRKDGGYGPWSHGVGPAPGIDWRDWEAYTGPDTDMPDVVNSRHVTDFLGKEHDKPFFVAMGLYRPHAPYTVPKRYFDRYDPEDIVLPELPRDDLDDIPQYPLDNFMPPVCDVRDLLPEWKASGYWKELIRAYLASVTFADEMVGDILDALYESPYADNTIVVLVGDNGFHQGQKQRFSKMALWREACHVPFIVSIPGGANAAVAAPVSLMDIYPTLVSLCGLPRLGSLYGNDLSPLLADPAMAWDKPCWSNYGAGNFVVHYGKWNYIRYRNYAAFPRSHELYDIERDEDELHNLAWDESNAELIRRIATHIPATWVEPE